MGFDGLLRSRASVLHGILNGIDDAVWNPVRRSADRRGFLGEPAGGAGRRQDARCRRGSGWRRSRTRCCSACISRLTWQKGLDLLLSDIDTLLGVGAQLVVVGSGEAWLEAGFSAYRRGRIPDGSAASSAMTRRWRTRSRRAIDALLVPSRFEPCGLTQLCALRYGALPVVARVGGLADTVIDANEAALGAGTGSGVQFAPVTQEMLQAAMLRTAGLWRQPEVWRRLQVNAMRTDVSWRRPAARYAALFRDVVAERA